MHLKLEVREKGVAYSTTVILFLQELPRVSGERPNLKVHDLSDKGAPRLHLLKISPPPMIQLKGPRI